MCSYWMVGKFAGLLGPELVHSLGQTGNYPSGYNRAEADGWVCKSSPGATAWQHVVLSAKHLG